MSTRKFHTTPKVKGDLIQQTNNASLLDHCRNWRIRVFSARTQGHPERGDVPGWVMVTLMTAALVAVIFAVARPALIDLFNRAIAAVSF